MNSFPEKTDDFVEELYVQSESAEFYFLEPALPSKQYDYPDLVDHWLQKSPTFTCNYEWSYYKQEIYYLEFTFFFDLAATPIGTAVDMLSSFINIHYDTLSLQLAILEKFVSTKRELKESENQLYPVPNEIVLDRLETLTLLLHSSITNSRLFVPRKKIKWTKDFSDFVEIFNIHYDTDCFSKVSKKEAFELFCEFIDFETHKSMANFSSTSSANLNKRKNPTQFYDSLKIEYMKFLDSKRN